MRLFLKTIVYWSGYTGIQVFLRNLLKSLLRESWQMKISFLKHYYPSFHLILADWKRSIGSFVGLRTVSHLLVQQTIYFVRWSQATGNYLQLQVENSTSDLTVGTSFAAIPVQHCAHCGKDKPSWCTITIANWRQRGWLVRALELKSITWVQILYWPPADVVLGSSEFNFLAALLNSQLVCLLPDGIFIVVKCMFIWI